MQELEKKLFHKNYDYMWRKLYTTPYFVKGPAANSPQSDDARARLKGIELLPSYTLCSKCCSEDYVPSEKTVMKVVAFYNQNITPEVGVFQFLNEDLAATDNLRYLTRSRLDERFIGTFYGYYLSSSNSGEPAGAILKIYKEGGKKDGNLRASLVTGIRTDENLRGAALTELFANEVVTKKLFDEYYDTLKPEEKRCYYYEGAVEITENSVLILFRGRDAEARKLVLTLNISSFPRPSKGQGRSYVGGLAFMLLTSDSPFDTRFYQMGIINTQFNVPSLKDEKIAKLLKFRTNGKDILLTSKLDRVWYELAVGQEK